MNPQVIETYYAPAERTERRRLKDQIAALSNNMIMSTLLKTLAGLLVVLNEERQIVAINDAFLAAIGVGDPEEVLGLRLGESLRCVHAQAPPNGCGTTPHCGTCGAAIATMAAIKDNQTQEQVCALSTQSDGTVNDVCLLIKGQPVLIDDQRWILIYAQDVTQQQFWINLERVFFHDINNALSSLIGYSELLVSDLPHNETALQVRDAAARIHSEIALQRSLSKHKDVQGLIRKGPCTTAEIKREVDLIIKGHQQLRQKHLIEEWPQTPQTLNTDPILVSRVLGNMLINALEASPAEGTVRLTTEAQTDAIVWHVWNQAHIHESLQKRIFQRHFSTKSKFGRGLGTYSMKLLGELCLRGQVSFTSELSTGTTFTFRLPRS
ncbi:MAG: ATP-binding protein [Desulfobacteraceae bacterium]|nr:ATP-binding protein [Desulfobacteraceae bacterium]